MRKVLSPLAEDLIERIRNVSQQLGWLIYVLGLVMRLAMWNEPFACPIRLDVNDLSPGMTAARVKLHRHSLVDSMAPTERTIRSQRTDGAQKLLLCVPRRRLNGAINSLSVDVGTAMLQMDATYLSKDLVVMFPDNTTMARHAIGRYLSKYSQRTLAALILEDNGLPVDHDVELDALGPEMIRPNLDLVASTLRNAQYLGLRCHLASDFERRPHVDTPLHWLLNKKRVDALTIRLTTRDTLSATLVRSKQEAMCALIEAQLRSLNNLNEPLHDSSFVYLISPLTKTHDDDVEQMIVYPPYMAVIMAPFALSMMIGSLGDKIVDMGFFYQAMTLSALSHWLQNAWALLRHHPLVQTIITGLVLDICLVGCWPKTMRCQLCQQAALHLIVLAVLDFLEALTVSLWLVPFMLSYLNSRTWFKVASAFLPLAAMWLHNPINQRTTQIMGPVVSLALIWLVRQ